MAAVLTLGSVAIAADGKTLTATISGGTGSGNAITNANGLEPHLASPSAPYNPFVFHIASVSVAGSTLTINLTNPVGSGETVKLDIAASATLSDSGGNTPTGQTNLAITNSSTVTVRTLDPITDQASFEYNGLLGSAAPLRPGNSDFADAAAAGEYPVEFVTDATDIALLTYSGATASVAIDNTAPATAPANGFWSVKPLTLTPLGAGKHLIRLSFGDYFYGIRLAGGTRTTYTVQTTKRTILANTRGAPHVPAATPIAVRGVGKAEVSAWGDVRSSAYAGTSFEFGFTGSGVEIATVTFSTARWVASIDGANEGALIVGGDAATHNQNQWMPLAIGLAAIAHTIRAVYVAPGGNTVHKAIRIVNGTKTTGAAAISDTTLAVASVSTLAINDWIKIDNFGKREVRQITNIVGTTLTLNTGLSQAHSAGAAVTSYSAPAGSISAHAVKSLSAKRIVAMGDSNTQGANALGFAGTPDANGNYYTEYDPRIPAAFKAAWDLNYELVNLGVQGTDSANQAGRKADIHDYGWGAYDYVVIWEGVNDIHASSITAAQYKTNVQAQITEAVPYLRTDGKVILMPPGTPNPGETGAGGLTIALCKTKLAELAAENPYTVLYLPNVLDDLVSGDFDGTLHYALSGHAKIAARLVEALSNAKLFQVGDPGRQSPLAFATL